MKRLPRLLVVLLVSPLIFSACGSAGGSGAERASIEDDDAEDDPDAGSDAGTDARPCDPLASPFGAGAGTVADPYTLCSVEQLSVIQGVHLSKHFLLTADLDLQGIAFEPIRGFNGVFDGGGHRISNLSIDSEVRGVGLFSEIQAGASVRRIELVEPVISGNDVVGTLAGGLEGGQVSEVSVIGGSVSGSDSVGGLVGNNNGSITNASATGEVNGRRNNVGGLVGFNTGNITSSSATGAVSGSYNVGGLVGINYQVINPGNITSSSATGNVRGTGAVGGFVGLNSGNVTSSYATGSVSGNLAVGGLVGFTHGSIMNSYAIGSVGGMGENVGGLIGESYNDTSDNDNITRSYFNAAAPDNSHGTPLSCTDFADPSNFVDWDFEDTWRMTATRPVLAWQEDPELPDMICSP